MKLIREDIIGNEIKFTVDVELYRKHDFGFTRLDTVHKIAEVLGFEISDIKTMQAIPIRDERVTITCRG